MDDETFFAWLDGELEPAEAARIGALVAADPELTRRAAEHRALSGRLRAAFDPIATAPVPDAILAVRPRQAEVVDLAAARNRRQPRSIPVGAQWAAMAATLAIGVVTGAMIGGGGAAGPVTREAGRLVAAGELESALYTRLASAPAEEGPRIGLTFRNSAGEICRTFTDEASSGLACRESGDWRIRGLLQGEGGGEGEFRMASGPDPRLAALVDEAIAGEPFDAEAERRAKESGWR